MKAGISTELQPRRPLRVWCFIFIFLPSIFLPCASAADEAVAALAKSGLLLDLDADHGVETKDGVAVKWSNQAPGRARDFVATRDAGRPALQQAVASLRGHHPLIFQKHELVNRLTLSSDRL